MRLPIGLVPRPRRPSGPGPRSANSIERALGVRYLRARGLGDERPLKLFRAQGLRFPKPSVRRIHKAVRSSGSSSTPRVLGAAAQSALRGSLRVWTHAQPPAALRWQYLPRAAAQPMAGGDTGCACRLHQLGAVRGQPEAPARQRSSLRGGASRRSSALRACAPASGSSAVRALWRAHERALREAGCWSGADLLLRQSPHSRR